MKKRIEQVLGYVLICLMVITVATVSWQAISRSVFSAPNSATEEIARFCLIWIGMLAAAYTYSQKMHIGVDMLTHSLVGGAKRLSEIAIWSFSGLFAALVLVYGGFRLVQLTLVLGQTSSILNAPMYLIYSVVPISGLLIIYFSIHFIIDTLRRDHSIEEPIANA